MKRLLTILLTLLVTALCAKSIIYVLNKNKQDNPGNQPNKTNAIYFWKTIWLLSDEERQFLTDHTISQIYIRYFDVYIEANPVETPVPEATIRFKEPVPENLEVIPTVFIDNDLFRYCKMNDFVQRLVNRIITMSETNNIRNIREVQLDCDWTKTTETDYFDFLKKVKAALASHNIKLSVTIRLHQLRMAAPPVDKGVLMCYNTGAIRDHETRNSILLANDVAPYAKRLKNYKLPLDLAYPTFSWAVWFSNDGKFQSLLRNANPADPNLIQTNGNNYRVATGFYQEGHYLAVDDQIRFESSGFDEILQIKKMLEHQLNHFSIILYHLDQTNLSKYTHDEINKMYTPFSDIR
ncbi:MAG: hypothetical protein LBV72_19075 [Tannerella sp.]|jgi:hypothetical protein|nr:hypothetical protein [Tannerella sp.]